MKIRRHIGWFLGLFPLMAGAQNLVPNPGFDVFTACPSGSSQIALCTPWNRPAGHTGTPDFYNECASSTLVGVPDNMTGHQFPASGSGYAGITCSEWGREYLQAPLLTALQAGERYRVSLKCAVSDMWASAPPVVYTNALGFYLSVAPPPVLPGSYTPLPVTASYQTYQNIERDAWTELVFTYVATGGENYITLGNFNSAADTTRAFPDYSSTINLYIDDVSVKPIIRTPRTEGDTVLCLGEHSILRAHDFLSYTWIRADQPGTVLSDSAVLEVSPTVTTVYRVYGGTDTLDVTVHVKPLPGVGLGSDKTFCAGAGERLWANSTAAHVPGTQYMWGNGSTGAYFMPTVSGTYRVTATLDGCSRSDTVEVTMENGPDLGQNQTICSGQALVLDATTPGATYRWQDQSTGAMFTADHAGLYSVTVSTPRCTFRDSVRVTEAPAPVIDLGNDTVVCSGSVFVLDASFPGATYRWQDNSVAATFRPIQSGMYRVSATLGGCSVSDTIHVTVNPTPEVYLGADSGLCPGEQLTLQVGLPGDYVWQDGSSDNFYTIDTPGVYWVTVTENGCSGNDSITVNGLPNPDFELGPDIRACAGDPVVLDASVPGATYVWQDLSTGNTFQPSQSGTYRVEVTLGGCTSADSVAVLFHPLPSVNLGADSTACEGATVLLDASAPGLSYRWQDGSTQATYSVTRPGNYVVEVTDDNGCKNTDAVRIGFDVPLSFEFSDSMLCYGNVWVLDIGNENAYCVWQDKTVGPRYTVAHEGTYIAVASNACGSHADTVTIGYRRCDCGLYLPNAFTPEQDGINERFGAVQNVECDLDEYEFTVFDRWGGVLFATRDIQFGWDGRAGGQTAPIGVYSYRVIYRFRSMPVKSEWGKVLLLR